MRDFLDHLAKDVLPALLERLVVKQNTPALRIRLRCADSGVRHTGKSQRIAVVGFET